MCQSVVGVERVCLKKAIGFWLPLNAQSSLSYKSTKFLYIIFSLLEKLHQNISPSTKKISKCMIKYLKTLYIFMRNVFQTSLDHISWSDHPKNLKFYMKYWYTFKNYHKKIQLQIHYKSWDITQILIVDLNPSFHTPTWYVLYISQNKYSNTMKLWSIAFSPNNSYL